MSLHTRELTNSRYSNIRALFAFKTIFLLLFFVITLQQSELRSHKKLHITTALLVLLFLKAQSSKSHGHPPWQKTEECCCMSGLNFLYFIKQMHSCFNSVIAFLNKQTSSTRNYWSFTFYFLVNELRLANKISVHEFVNISPWPKGFTRCFGFCFPLSIFWAVMLHGFR